MPRVVSRKSSLVRFLDEAQWPVYLIDRTRQILFCNQPLATLSGKSVDDIVGSNCGYHSQPQGNNGLSGLCPPASAFDSVVSMQGVVHLPTPSGPVSLQASFCPLTQSDAGIHTVAGLLVVVLGTPPSAETASPTGRSSEIVTGAEQLHAELWKLRSMLRREFQVTALIGHSAAIGRVREQVRLAAGTQAAVLVTGPAGSGRERVARTIHASAATANSTPLVTLAATVLDAELLRTTMEAYIKRSAELETDQAPTLLLLDADRLTEDAQQELMGFLAIEELGIRTLATAQLPLIDLARQDAFYPRLAHRLSTVTVTLPALRDRPEDIPLLAQYLVEKLNAREGRFVDGFAPRAIEQLIAFPWSRNVDELKQTVADCYRQAAGPVLEVGDLPARIRLGLDAALHPVVDPVPENLEQYLEDVERSMIARALKRSGGNKTQAANMLSVSRGRLLRRIEQLRVSSPTDPE